MNDNSKGQHRTDGYSFVSYQVSIPAWAANEAGNMKNGQPTLGVGQHTRTETIVEWLEDNMRLGNYFKSHKGEIDRWRKRYTVEESEKYILMINLSGLMSQYLDI